MFEIDIGLAWCRALNDAREAHRVKETFPVPHNITVSQLALLLEKLDNDDVLVINRVSNLSIERDGKYVGFINLLEGHQEVDFYEEDE